MCSDQRLSVCNVQTAASRRAQAARAKTAAPRRQVPSRRRQVPEPRVMTSQSRQEIFAQRRSKYADYKTLELATATSDRNDHGQLKREPSLRRMRSR